jgi:hypothetical protein
MKQSGLRLLYVVLLLPACSADAIPAGHYILTTGQETDTFTMDPAPVTFQTSSMDRSGVITVIATSDKPITSIEVGITGANFYMEDGVDAQGVRRAQATSNMLDGSTMAGHDVPLFIGRTDAFCRPPGALKTAQGNHPPVGIFWSQWLWMAGASSNNQIISEGYDLVGWNQADTPSFLAALSCPSLPCQIESIANYAGQFSLAIGPNWAMAIDVSNQTTTGVDAPADLSSWSYISGGRTYETETGASFVVGPTRSDSASQKVLELASDGSLDTFTLDVPRQSAASTYVYKQGLLIVGGSSDGPGAEYLPESGTAFVSLPYPADPVIGAALVPESDGTRVWRMGGKLPADGSPAPTVVYDIACTNSGTDAGTDCSAGPEPLPSFDMDVPITNAYGFSFNGSRLVIGEQDDGTMVVRKITDSGLVPVTLREPRQAATVYTLPNGFAALIGGTLISDGSQAKSLELLAY